MEQNQAIFKALQKGDLKEVKKHLDQLPTINIINEMGESLLHIAVRLNNPSMIDLILAYGPDLSQINDEEITPLELALQLQNGVAIQRILKSPLPIPSQLLQTPALSPYLILFRREGVEPEPSNAKEEKDFSQIQDIQEGDTPQDFSGVFDLPQEMIVSNQEDFTGVYAIYPQEKHSYGENQKISGQQVELEEFKATVEEVTEQRDTRERVISSYHQTEEKDVTTIHEVTDVVDNQVKIIHEEGSKEERETIKEVTQEITTEKITVKGSQELQKNTSSQSSPGSRDSEDAHQLKQGGEDTLSYQNFKKRQKSPPADDGSLQQNKRRSRSTGGSLASDINRANSKGDYPLFIAIKKGDLSMVEKLLSLGADINIRDTEGHHALMVASYYGHSDLVQYFIKQGLPVNLKTPNAHSSLYYAVAMDFPQTVELLIKAGANLDQRVKNKTCLMNAAYHGREEIVRLLIKYGANPKIKTIHGKTAYDYAVIKNNQPIIDFLEQFNEKKDE